jgi:hypothetical protein
LLYLIEYLCQIKVEDLYQAFSERSEVFESIREYFGNNNKKISDIAGAILNIFNPVQKKLSEPNSEKVNLFVIDNLTFRILVIRIPRIISNL